MTDHMRDLSGVKVVVVGASSGIGRAVAVEVLAAGAEVVVAARRTDRLDDLVAEAGSGHVVELDVTDAASCVAFGPSVAERLGTADLVLFATGLTLLRRVVDTTAEDWDTVLRTNVSGINQAIRSVLPHTSPTGIIAAISSDGTFQPRAGLAAYIASKAALRSSFDLWRHEHAPRRFSLLSVGGTSPTEASDGFDPELFGPVMEDWLASGTMPLTFMQTPAVAESLVDILSAVLPHPGVNIDDIVLRSPAPLPGTMAAQAMEADEG